MGIKAVITKEAAEAIEHIRADRHDADEKMIEVAFGSDGWAGPKSKVLNNFDRMTLVRALVNGYEVEQTPDEKVRGYYEEIDEYRRQSKGFDSAASDEYHRMCDAIRTTLDLLGITIEGVNA